MTGADTLALLVGLLMIGLLLDGLRPTARATRRSAPYDWRKEGDL